MGDYKIEITGVQLIDGDLHVQYQLREPVQTGGQIVKRATGAATLVLLAATENTDVVDALINAADVINDLVDREADRLEALREELGRR